MLGTTSGLGEASVGDGEGEGDGDGNGEGDGEGDGEGEGDGAGDACSSTSASLANRVATFFRASALVAVMSALALWRFTSPRKSETALRSPAALPALAACVIAFIFVCRSACGLGDEQPASRTHSAARRPSRLTSGSPAAASG
jgi:hypothetical protein